MYSGDIRRSLQITKRAVEICRDKYLKDNPVKGTKITKVVYQDVICAFDELFNSKTVQVLQGLQKNEVVTILALYNELTSSKCEKVLMDDVQDRCNVILKQVLGWQAKVQTHIFREIVKRLQAFGIVNMQIEHQKITDNVHLQLGVYKDDIVNGFKLKDYVLKVALAFPILKELFQGTQDAIDMKQH